MLRNEHEVTVIDRNISRNIFRGIMANGWTFTLGKYKA